VTGGDFRSQCILKWKFISVRLSNKWVTIFEVLREEGGSDGALHAVLTTTSTVTAFHFITKIL
jgi:hypothetical protein